MSCRRAKPSCFRSIVCCLFAVVFSAAAPALANPPHEFPGWNSSHPKGNVQGKGRGLGHHKRGDAPELDPSGVAGALLLLVGGTLVARSRRRPLLRT